MVLRRAVSRRSFTVGRRIALRRGVGDLRDTTVALFDGVAAVEVRMRVEFAAAVAVAVGVDEIGAAE